MKERDPVIDERKVDEFIAFHLQVLKLLLQGKTFVEIQQERAEEMDGLDYLGTTRESGFFSFDDDGQLQAAYPISPKQSDYRIYVEGVGAGYAMCAIDSLGAAYLFNAKTKIESEDPATKTPISITIDPDDLDISLYSDIAVTVPKSMPQKKEGEALDSAVDICPLIGFFESQGSIPEEQLSLVGVIPFEQAFEHGQRAFNLENWKKDFRASLLTSLRLHREGALPEEAIVQTYLENASDNFVKSVPRDYVNTILIQQLQKNRGIKMSTKADSEVTLWELTDKGATGLQAFLK